jgi:ATP-dependent Lon protease
MSDWKSLFGKGELGEEGAPLEPGARRIPMLPLRDIIIFPQMVIPLFVGREKSIAAIEAVMKGDKEIFLSAQKDAKVNDPAPEGIYDVGTIGQVLQTLRLPDGTVKILVEGKRRARILQYLSSPDFYFVDVEEINEVSLDQVELEGNIRALTKTFEEYVKLNRKIPTEMLTSVLAIESPGRLADSVATHLDLKLADKQKILEIFDTGERIKEIIAKLQSEIEILKVERRIRGRVKKQMERTQKEYYLNEQMRAIQKELGQKDEFKAELTELEESITEREMTEEAEEKALKELKRLKMMSPMSAEATVSRNYIDWLISLPWGDLTEENIDIDEADKILDEDHYGLKKPKERVLEYLAVQKLVKKLKGPILCFVGPPGVGKTSLGKSIARATGRNFVRQSLGGVRDEAEIRGHRRTYIGALPGKVIQSLKKAKSSNPVFLLDEVDKMSTDFRGDPASALLEVLDPEQNHAFNDHFLDVDYDLSKVMFITTANNLHQIPRPLMDRMEVIHMDGYIEDEKVQIAKKFLVPKQTENHGLSEETIKIHDEAIFGIIRNYTKEAGVRNLEREIAAVCRKVAKKQVRAKKQRRIHVSLKNLESYLGVARYRFGCIEAVSRIGLANGLAWTEFGGEMLTIEATVMPGKGALTITGKLGEVMQESARAAMSYVRSRAINLGLPKDFYQNVDVHVHVPEGAIPKDGPSAGITIATAITSALTRIPVNCDIAMTGEITLRGRVLPIGGLREKLLACLRGGIKTVLVPIENEKDLKEVPSRITSGLDIKVIEHVDEVLREALVLDNADEFYQRITEKEKPVFTIKDVEPPIPPEPDQAAGDSDPAITH